MLVTAGVKKASCPVLVGFLIHTVLDSDMARYAPLGENLAEYELPIDLQAPLARVEVLQRQLLPSLEATMTLLPSGEKLISHTSFVCDRHPVVAHWHSTKPIKQNTNNRITCNYPLFTIELIKISTHITNSDLIFLYQQQKHSFLGIDHHILLLSKMQKIKTKHVIHLNTHKGRLRKIVWGKNLLQLDDSTDLVVASEHLTEQQTNQNKPRQNFFLRKYGRKTNKEVVEANQDSEQQTGQALERGAFRAIHTACPYDSIKGFPLRSMTPVKPFRRGIRADSFKSNVLDLQKLEYDRPVTRVPRNKIGMSNTMPVRNSFPLVANELSEVLAAPPSASQNAQQFFMYSSTRIQKKESVQKDANKSPRMVAGIKIQPFRKYHIRQIQKGIYFGQNHKSHHSAM